MNTSQQFYPMMMPSFANMLYNYPQPCVMQTNMFFMPFMPFQQTVPMQECQPSTCSLISSPQSTAEGSNEWENTQFSEQRLVKESCNFSNNFLKQKIGGSYKKSNSLIQDKNVVSLSQSSKIVSKFNQPREKQEETKSKINEWSLKLQKFTKLVLSQDFKKETQEQIQIKQDPNLAKVMLAFYQRARMFRKSKQEMLKIIVRRIQKHHRHTKVNKRDKKFKLYGGFKSMNIAYLSKLFADEDFVESYKLVANNFNKQFEEENNSKIADFIHRVSNCTNDDDIENAIESLDQKGKMPWPAFWMQKIGKVLIELYWKFSVKQIKF